MSDGGYFLRIGTRGSPLALAQTRLARSLIAAAQDVPEEKIAIVIIRTSGDLIQDRPLADAGGKGLFTKELDSALLAGLIDLAVHSAKDLPTLLPDGIDIGGYLPREDVRDVFVCAKASRLEDLPQGASIGSASLRRQAQARRIRPDLAVSLLRGNVETRLAKVERGEVDATFLALAGLKRLGLADRATSICTIEQFLPAVGQGAIAITNRDDDSRTMELLTPVLDRETGLALAAERAFLAVLDGSCRTPIAGHARIEAGRLRFQGQLLRPDGSQSYQVEEFGELSHAEALGLRAGGQLLGRAPADLLNH